MKISFALTIATMLFLTASTIEFCAAKPLQETQSEEAVPQPQRYELGIDSQITDDIPHGTITDHEFLESKIFPGTKRRYSVYVPAQYDPAKPAALMVFQDCRLATA